MEPGADGTFCDRGVLEILIVYIRTAKDALFWGVWGAWSSGKIFEIEVLRDAI